MPAQLHLGFMRSRITSADVPRLLEYLRGCGWVKAWEIEDHFGWSERSIRKLASESAGEIISGQNGYKLTREATIEEVAHASKFLRSQAHEMTRRAVEIERIRHGNE